MILRKKINGIYGIKGVSGLKIRQSGPLKMVECVVTTLPSLSLYRAHELTSQEEDLIAKDCKDIESVLIHSCRASERRYDFGHHPCPGYAWAGLQDTWSFCQGPLLSYP
ncbi:cation transporter dimerization domain-containing protein [Thermodesulfobacteriota bacterium]